MIFVMSGQPTPSSSAGRVARVRAARGGWMVSLQLRTAADGDPGPLLASSVDRMLALLTAASAVSPQSARGPAR